MIGCREQVDREVRYDWLERASRHIPVPAAGAGVESAASGAAEVVVGAAGAGAGAPISGMP